MDLSQIKISNELLYNSLVKNGNIFELKPQFNISEINIEIAKFENEWRPYNPRKTFNPRFGLSLTSLDGKFGGIDLDSITEYNIHHGVNYLESNFSVPTLALNNCKSIYEPIQFLIPFLGRSHLLKFQSGGHFPFHRDSQWLGEDTFRLISLLSHCGPKDICFVFDRERLLLEPGKIYFLNTKIEHCLFSFAQNATLAVFNINLCAESVQSVKCNLRDSR